MSITPSRIEWRGPGGFTVVLDEDFVSLRSGRGDSLEETEIHALIDLIHEAKRCRSAGSAPVPVAPNVPF